VGVSAVLEGGTGKGTGAGASTDVVGEVLDEGWPT